ncbi:RNA polymerase sigma-70 factor [Actinomadura barringtoniae]|uniref:RNA polymerase sigma-70 factor n=1 Tax=Actinomadura barringtoniae TaxID=1427535 RepID=A0A939PRV9_9ACTN|nr:RNA polymerase sigma-70 factor [Actinomadura barringtoniae]MBO2455099.1 RNA polymerase sigma-70 factor [Actinomadura barringtoniae]
MGVAVDEVFQEYRNLLFSVAYRMLGTAVDAEDAVQDAWIKWSAADRGDVTDPKAYLIRITTNVSLDRLRSAQAQRETYVGPWLPEPMLTSPDVAEQAELAESVSMALLVVLETLSPLERAAFVLKEVFGFPFAEIGTALDRSEASVRQLATRARKHVEAGRSRFEVDAEKRTAATERFLDAMGGGDINALMEVLAPDVTMWSDGGGKVRAPLRNIVGAEKVARWVVGITGDPYAGVDWKDMAFRRVTINGSLGLVIDGPDGVLSAITVELGADGKAVSLHLVANPDKLKALNEGLVLDA